MTQQIERTEVEAVRPELPYVELTDLRSSTTKKRGIQQAMHKFAHDVMRPAGIAIDKLSAEEAVAPDSPYWEFMATVAASGIEFDAASDDVAPQALARMQSIIIEEFGWAMSV
jgi:hypothetical protein